MFSALFADEVMTKPHLDMLVQLMTQWLKATPMCGTLFVMIGADIVTGVMLSCVRRTLNSSCSWRGMTRKIMMILLVGVGAVLEPFAQGLPLAQIVAMFYCGAEGISLLENAAALGVPLPTALVSVLKKLQEDGQKKLEQRGPATTATTIVTPGAMPPAIVVQASPEIIDPEQPKQDRTEP